MRFEEKKFVQIRTLAERWDSSPRRIYDLLGRGLLKAWHPEGKVGQRGLMIEVQSVLEAEKEGFVEIGE